MTRSTAGNCPDCGQSRCMKCGNCKNIDCENYVSCPKSASR